MSLLPSKSNTTFSFLTGKECHEIWSLSAAVVSPQCWPSRLWSRLLSAKHNQTCKPVTKIPPDPPTDGGREVIYLHVPWTECHNQWMESWKRQHPWRFLGGYNCGFGWKGSRLHPGSEVGLWRSEGWWCWTRPCCKKNVLIVNRHFCSPLQKRHWELIINYILKHNVTIFIYIILHILPLIFLSQMRGIDLTISTPPLSASAMMTTVRFVIYFYLTKWYRRIRIGKRQLHKSALKMNRQTSSRDFSAHLSSYKTSVGSNCQDYRGVSFSQEVVASFCYCDGLMIPPAFICVHIWTQTRA